MMMTTRRTRELAHKVLAQQERKRVADLLERDRIYNQRQKEREAAELQVAEGFTVRIGDAVDEPTPEWLAKGDFRTFTPRLEDGTVVTVKAYRRVRTAMVIKLWSQGRLTDDQARACIWYRDRHEMAGVSGRYKTNYISLTGNVGGSGGAGQSPMALHAAEAEARAQYRAARAAIGDQSIKFFDAVVLLDQAISSAARLARCRNGMAQARFRECAQRLVDHCAGEKVEFEEISEL